MTPPDGAAARIAARLDALARGPLGVAVSGGGDSMALAAVAAEWGRARGVRVEAATVDHRLRPESADEAAWTAAACARLGVRHETLVWQAPPARGNLPAQAREARYALLGGWAARRGLAAVALAHTLDDQAETVLMRLARGSGVDGLSGMAERIERRGMLWLRPALAERRAALRGILRARGQDWIEDPTNRDPAFARVRARHALEALAPLGLDAVGLAAAATRLRAQREVLEDAARALAARALRVGPAGEARIDRAAYAEARADTRYRLLAATLAWLGGGRRPRQAALERADAAILAAAPGVTLHGCMILPAPARLPGLALVCREPRVLTAPVPAPGPWEGWSAPGAPADAMIGPLGAEGLRALEAARRRGEWTAPEDWSRLPRPARLAAPALWRAGRLAAAPGAGHAAAGAEGWRLSRAPLAL
ncbi:tRNA lysidine(34) synthetase TilS [Oceanicella actignis]|uniref:tRNA(Ile)-lysidine synthase n=1 Tax=Oceanicella actignis TaxID=1189325 RepID=A0A1M7TVT8_9RHOB|nr:tRNA lysidine(34) synthetase TilS [Oceanicella actignis]SES80706.1 tRNA(Ile)-lysidine synthase [Oceanicella actignis]SHN74800.1 tRNA(Ile)-lysidine synthase [Oceanicella actignis]